jgi:membrane protease YdiL (CAAX protease family)
MRARTRSGRSGSTTVELFHGLRAAPILIAYLAAGFVASFYLLYIGYGTAFLVSLIANLALLGIYVLIINVTTAAAPPLPTSVSRPTLEGAIATLYAIFLIVRALTQIPALGWAERIPVYYQIDTLIVGSLASIISQLWPGGGPEQMPLLLGNLFWVLLLPLAMFLALGYRPSSLGLTWNRWWAALPVLAAGLAWWLMAGNSVSAASLGDLTTRFAITFFTYGLAYEFFYRGLLLSRLSALTGNALNAMAIAALLFGLAQVPVFIARDGFDVTLVIARVFVAASAQASLAWGYIYLRTRSIAPGALWHSSPWIAFPF